MARTVVVTTDVSDASFCVLPHAARAAEAAGLELVVLHVLDPTIELTAFPASAKTLLASRQRTARRRIHAVLEDHGLEAKVVVAMKALEESLTEAIIGEACAQGAVLLAMNSLGAHAGVRTALLGSVALAILAESHLPVLVTGAKAMQPPTRGPYRVLFAADGTPRAEAVAQSLAAFFHDGHISASVVHLAAQEPVQARTPATRTARAVGRWLPDGVLRSTGTVFPRDPSASEADQLLQAAADTKASVVALTLRPSWLQRRLVKRGLAGQLLGQCAFPLIFGH